MKNNNVLEYKGYHTIIEYSAADKVLHGKIECINDLIDFEAENAVDIENEFHLAVDDYLQFCKEVGKAPDKEYSGSFNVRMPPELHKQLVILASKKGETLNKIVQDACKAYCDSPQPAGIMLTCDLSQIVEHMTAGYASANANTDLSRLGNTATYRN